MTSTVWFCLWNIGANQVAVLTGRDEHRTSTYLLNTAGVPLPGCPIWQNGPIAGLLGLVAGKW